MLYRSQPKDGAVAGRGRAHFEDCFFLLRCTVMIARLLRYPEMSPLIVLVDFLLSQRMKSVHECDKRMQKLKAHSESETIVLAALLSAPEYLAF